jgi:hypothetical protein
MSEESMSPPPAAPPPESPPPASEPESSSSGGHNTLLYVLVGIVIVLLLALVGLVLFGGGTTAPAPPPEGEAPPAEGEVPPVETSVPPPFPTEGPTPTPISGDPRDLLGEPTFLDTFDDNRNWDEYENECFKSEISGGKFNLTAKGNPDFVTITCWELTWPEITDYYLEVVAEAPEACEGIDRWGLFFRGPDTNRGYVLLLTCDGRYVMANIDGTGVHFVAGPDTSIELRAGPGQTNRIGVAAKDTNFWIYINGVKVAEVQDSAYESGIRIGLAVGSTNTVDMTVRFDDYAYWDLPE